MESDSHWLVHLLGSPAADAAPRAGDAVELRRPAGGLGLAVFGRDGQWLGRLPPEVAAALAPGVVARIAALVPRPRGGGLRVHVLVPAPG